MRDWIVAVFVIGDAAGEGHARRELVALPGSADRLERCRRAKIIDPEIKGGNGRLLRDGGAGDQPAQRVEKGSDGAAVNNGRLVVAD